MDKETRLNFEIARLSQELFLSSARKSNTAPVIIDKKRNANEVFEEGEIDMFHCGVSGDCSFKSLCSADVRRHVVEEHDSRCNVRGCNYKSVSICDLNSHKTEIHNVKRRIFFVCGIKKCDFKSDKPERIKNHEMNVHGINIKEKDYYKCYADDCEFKTKTVATLQLHKVNVHASSGGLSLACLENGCAYKTKDPRMLKDHKRNIHDLKNPCLNGERFINFFDLETEYDLKTDEEEEDVTTTDVKPRGKQQSKNVTNGAVVDGSYLCGVEGCEFRGKSAAILSKHKALVHDNEDEAFYYVCEVDGCEYKTKMKNSIRRHKSVIHGVHDVKM